MKQGGKGDEVCAARVIILAGRMAGVRKKKPVTVCREGPDQDIGEVAKQALHAGGGVL